MEQIRTYISESYYELMNNVSWPTTKNLSETTLVVLVAILLLAAIIYVMDVTSGSILRAIYSL